MSEMIHRQVWEDIPWYVNGTLDAPARARVDAHAAQCEACKQELAMQRRVASILEADTPMAQSARSNWEDVANRLSAPPVTQQTPWQKVTGWLVSRRNIVMPVATGVAAALVLAGVAVSWQGPTLYRTLTTPEAVSVADEIRVRALPGIDHAALLSDLEALGLVIVSEDGPDTLMHLSLPAADAARAMALKALADDPRIALVAGAEQ